jgi:hypothetical protein
MRTQFLLLHLLLFSLISCGQSTSKVVSKETAIQIINPNGKTLESRINPPEGYDRIAQSEKDFGFYLRNLPVKKHGEFVRTFNGQIKSNNDVYEAVIDLPIGNKDLHQCADAVMRLRAEYLWKQKKYDDIHFNFTNGFRADYKEWMNGKRIKITNNTCIWVQSAQSSNTAKDLWNYLEVVFSYAGTLSLSKELVSVNVNEMQIGDVFIKGGSPGHVVIVADMAENKNTGTKLFLLLQSYMPAQEIQLLKNPTDSSLGPWYNLQFGDILYTPEWTFTKNQLMRFK